MKLVRCLLVAFVAAFPTAGSSAVVQFTAPAGNAPAGHRGGAIFDAVLPSGRIVTPLGGWRRQDAARQALMRGELQRIRASPGLSSNTGEQVTKSLG